MNLIIFPASNTLDQIAQHAKIQTSNPVNLLNNIMSDQEPDAEESLYDGPSKSQRKRDVHAVRDLGAQLLLISDDQLGNLPYEDIIDAVRICKKIKKGNARKRQIQYIGKLLRGVDLEEVQLLVDRFDASSRSHAMHFHQLETWRDRLIEQDKDVLTEILTQLPDIDRQHIRQLSRNAIAEHEKQSQPPVHFRKLFKYLKSESDKN